MTKEQYTEEEIRGRSCCVCQKHYDRRATKGIYTDEIVSKEKCAICQSNKKFPFVSNSEMYELTTLEMLNKNL